MDFFTLNAAKRYADEAMEGAGAIQGEKGEKGETGEKGADGVSCTHSWNGTELTVTSASGTSKADLKGEKGDTGEKGADAVIQDLVSLTFNNDVDVSGAMSIGWVDMHLLELGNAYLMNIRGTFETVGTTKATIQFNSDVINSKTMSDVMSNLVFWEDAYSNGQSNISNFRNVTMTLIETGFKIQLNNVLESTLHLQGVVTAIKKTD